MNNKIYFFIYLFSIVVLGCSSEKMIFEKPEDVEEVNDNEPDPNTNAQDVFKILSLGDSYTIGQSVCATCRFPEQLKDSLIVNFKPKTNFDLKIIAQTGWTTTNLINAISTENPDTNYDLVTLLIGVNNEYQDKSFSIYENEFPQLVNTAIAKAKGIKSKIIVVSIPDYAFTPFGKGNTTITENINKYNGFAESYCNSNNITFINITDITRLGLDNPELVASDGLHPSKLAYSKFVERLLPISIKKLE